MDLRPIQFAPLAEALALTRRMSGMPSLSQRTDPPLAAVTGARIEGVARMSATSFGFNGPAAATAESLPSFRR
ncbi:MAG: hypothetical protein WDM89_13250 [Rhizomicrobium sp.]